MKYVYGNITALTPKHLVIIKQFSGELRKNEADTKFILKVPEDKLKYFTDFPQVNLADARAYLGSSAWTGVSWFSNLFG
jgi:hypothetical protein